MEIYLVNHFFLISITAVLMYTLHFLAIAHVLYSVRLINWIRYSVQGVMRRLPLVSVWQQPITPRRDHMSAVRRSVEQYRRALLETYDE